MARWSRSRKESCNSSIRTDFVTDAALDKVIKEFKMWNSMSRKPVRRRRI